MCALILGLELIRRFQFGAQLAILLSELLDEALLFEQLLLNALTARVDEPILCGDLSNTKQKHKLSSIISSNFWQTLRVLVFEQ